MRHAQANAARTAGTVENQHVVTHYRIPSCLSPVAGTNAPQMSNSPETGVVGAPFYAARTGLERNRAAEVSPTFLRFAPCRPSDPPPPPPSPPLRSGRRGLSYVRFGSKAVMGWAMAQLAVWPFTDQKFTETPFLPDFQFRGSSEKPDNRAPNTIPAPENCRTFEP
jgi:hypothetical protein